MFAFSWIKQLRRVTPLFLGLLLCGSKLPDLTPRDLAIKSRQIMMDHVSYKTLTPTIARRVIERFLNELDPLKCYLTQEEIAEYLNPDSALIEQVIGGFSTAEFGPFEDLYMRMCGAIQRRTKIEAELVNVEPPKGVRSEQFKKMEWAENEQALKERVLAMRGMQIDTAKRWVTEEPVEQVLARIAKYRQSRESQFLPLGHTDGAALCRATILKALASSLDAHTAYMTPGEAEQFLISVEQKLSGIGALLRDDLDGLTISKLTEGGPAERSGLLKKGDKILAVNGTPIVGMDVTDAVDLIRGPSGSVVNLSIIRKSHEEDSDAREKLEIALERGEVILKERRLEYSKIPFGNQSLGYIQLHSFYNDQTTSSSKDLQAALDSLQQEGSLAGVLLDLRRNPGGLVDEAVKVAGSFMDRGVVCSMKLSDGTLQRYRNFSGECLWKGPLVVLIDQASASASEIVAQSLQDWGRAIIVGDEHSFGKGSAQVLTVETRNKNNINPQGEYKVTFGLYYTVSGRSPQLEGVKSDIVVPGMLCHSEIGERFVDYALESDHIAPSYMDDMSDISMFQRLAVGRSYRENLQAQDLSLLPIIDQMRDNSGCRVANSVTYQNFLAKLRAKEVEPDEDSLSLYEDFQLNESLNVLRDLVLLTAQQTSLKSA